MQILTVKPGEDDYLDTSFLLRQASPYMKIKYALYDHNFLSILLLAIEIAGMIFLLKNWLVYTLKVA